MSKHSILISRTLTIAAQSADKNNKNQNLIVINFNNLINSNYNFFNKIKLKVTTFVYLWSIYNIF